MCNMSLPTIKSSYLAFLVASISVFAANAQELSLGVVQDSLSISNGELISAYLPSDYSDDHSWPLVFFFDPGGRASLPINKYAALSEEYGFIAVCTYNSRNGPMDPGLRSFDMVSDYFKSAYSIDEKGIITSGFSGGSRMALATAASTSDIKGVIACGAGQPGPEHLRSAKGDQYSYVGLVGNLDFNFLEMLELEEQLSQQGIRNMRIVFEGDHHWPSPEDFELAYLWIRFDTDGSKNESLLKQLLMEKIESRVKNGDFLYAKSLLQNSEKMGLDMNEIATVFADMNESMDDLDKEWDKVVKAESKIIKSLSEKIFAMDRALALATVMEADEFKYWSSTIKNFKRKSEKNIGLKGQSYHRIKSFIGANMAERSFMYKQHLRNDLADQLRELWELSR